MSMWTGKGHAGEEPPEGGAGASGSSEGAERGCNIRGGLAEEQQQGNYAGVAFIPEGERWRKAYIIL